MKINREHLLAVLNAAKPALSSHAFVPVLSHFCFDKDGTVYAFDDEKAIRILTHDFGFVGALPGDRLLKIIGSYSTSEVSFKDGKKDNEVIITAGRSQSKLQMLSEDEFVLEFPDVDDAAISFEADQNFLLGLSKCLKGVGADSQSPHQLGVTLDGNSLYSTDNITISAFELSEVEIDYKAIIMPTDFCNIVLDMAKRYPKDVIEIFVFEDDTIVASIEDQAEVMAKLVPVKKPLVFADLIDQYVGDADDFDDIYDGMAECFSRAKIIASSEEDPVVEIEVTDDSIVMITRSKDVEQTDTIPLDEDDLAEEGIKFLIDPQMPARACGFCSKVMMMEGAMVFSDGGSFIHLVSHSSEA